MSLKKDQKLKEEKKSKDKKELFSQYRTEALNYNDSYKTDITIFEEFNEQFILPMFNSGVGESDCVRLIEDVGKILNWSARLKRMLKNSVLALKMNKRCTVGGMNPYSVDLSTGKIKVDEASVAGYFKSVHYIYSNEKFWKYKDGKYVVVEEREIRDILTHALDLNLIGSSSVSACLETIKDVCFISFSDENGNPIFDADKDIINCKNGLFDLKTGQLKEHTHEYLSMVQFPFDYLDESETDCPLFDDFLKTVFCYDDLKILTTWQMMGYFLAPHQKAKKAFILLGPSNTGKSTLLNIFIYGVVGENNYSSVALQDLGKDFSLSSLIGKALNCADDLSSRSIEDVGTFKTITGGGPVDIRIKHQPSVTMHLNTKLVFTCNSLPTNLSDQSSAFYERLVIIRFEHQIRPEEMDRDIVEKIIKEKDSIFSKSINSLMALKKNNYKFPKNEANEAEINKYRLQSNPVAAFVSDFFDCNDGYGYSCAKAYDFYLLICRDSNTKPISRREFKQALDILGITERQSGADRLRVYEKLRMSKDKLEDYCNGRDYYTKQNIMKYISFNRIVRKSQNLSGDDFQMSFPFTS